MHTTTTSKVSQLRERLARRNAERLGDESEEGFTLIELMVVLLILAILLAIAIPTFLGVKGGAQDRASQSNLTNALIVAKTVAANNNGTYPTAIAATMGTSEPALAFITTAITTGATSNTVSVVTDTTNSTIVMTSLSASGTCWVAEDNQGASGVSSVAWAKQAQGDWYASYTTVGTGASTCNAALTAAPTGISAWGNSYPA